MKKFLKNSKGITGADAVLGVALAMLFSGIIATLAYNIYVTSNSLKRSSQALEYITSTFEYVANQYYDDITADSIKVYINKLDTDNISTEDGNRYKATVIVSNYNPTNETLDLVKEITMSVTYKLGNKDQKIEMKTAKAREKLEVPNRPELDKIKVSEGKYLYPIKYVNDEWRVTTKNDVYWYDYDNGIWATAVVTSSQKSIGDVITNTDGTIYLWIPRFEYNPNPSSTGKYKVSFLYKNTDKQIVNENGKTKIKDRELKDIPYEFTKENLTGTWIQNGGLKVDPYYYFNMSNYALDTTKYSGKLW